MSIEAMRQALEALKVYGSHAANCDHLMLLTSLPPKRKPCSCGLVATIQALRQAIEQVEQAPICAHGVSKLKCDFCKRPEQAQPVAWYDPKVMNEDRGISWTPGQFHTAPLYTAPPQRKPLTDEEIVKMAEANLHAFSQYIDGGEAYYEGEIDFARAIEAAHGIKE
jgi:hypothetical protein